MARKSVIAREVKRAKMVAKYAERRKALKDALKVVKKNAEEFKKEASKL